MHVSGVLLLVGMHLLPVVSTQTYGQEFALMLWVLMLHVGVQIPVGLLASRWAAQGHVLGAGLAAWEGATVAVWGFWLLVSRDPVGWDFWWQSWGCLCVSLSAYVWLCTLRRSTFRRFTGWVVWHVGTVAVWALLRPPRRGPR
ncbi:hypothetical protein ACWEHT_13025 [Streptomyces sp. NPDC004646]